ncbi:MAG: aminotransferase class I/II-fold pyridoxal phosphate-dependent enzyme [Dehalococcoidia bacterium]|jgi:aminotransferase|nr:aminotransferase class I/II-fold pyridoxal phosphate-dependent enzyme [Dehalococcoidia bacterium]
MKKRYVISKHVRDISPSGIRKFFDILASLEGVISLGVGEPDFVTPWHIREAGIYSLEKGHTSYTSNYGMIELREEIARYLNSRYGLVYNPQNEILITVGVSEGLDLAMRAILDPGDEVIGHEPIYVSYKPCTTLAGGKFIPIPTTVENAFKVNADDIEKRVTSRTKALMLGYPSNPTGAVMDRAGLMEIAEVAQRHDLIVVSDEVYERLVYGVEHTCFASLPGMQERTIHLGGFSKAYAMTGWRLGFAAAREEIIEAMMKIHQYTMLCAPTMAQMAALEALREGDVQVEEMVAEYDRRRRVIVDGFNHIGLTCFEPRGAFYAFPSVKSTGLSSEDFAERLLREEKVAVVPGDAFGESGEGYVRCCYATSMEEIEEALERMGRFVKKHRSRGAKR